MIDITIELNSNQVGMALKKVPDLLFTNLHEAVLRGAIEVGRSARRHAPKAHSTLAQSIRHIRTDLLEYVVEPGVEYGSMVAAKTGPQGAPPFLSIYDWVRVKRLRPRRRGDTQEDLAWLIMRSISRRGTPGNDFMGRAAHDNRGRVHDLINNAVGKSLLEAGLRG